MDIIIYTSLLLIGGIIGFIINDLEQKKPKVHKFTPIDYETFNQIIAKEEGDGEGGIVKDLGIGKIKQLTKIYCRTFLKYEKAARNHFIQKFGR